MDAFSAKVLLDTVANISSKAELGQIHDFVKSPDKLDPSNAIKNAKKLGFVKGAEVKLFHDKEIGIVTGYNTTSGGFYPGSRYPITVKFERGIFEYSVEGIELVK